MFEGKTLVAVGDSFVYGHLGDDLDAESCHARSWVSKLEKLGGFESSYNLGAPGGSNLRNYRVLLDFLNDYKPNETYVVFIAASEVSRHELTLSRQAGINLNFPITQLCPYERKHQDYGSNCIGNWTQFALERDSDTSRSQRVIDYINLYYGLFYNIEYSNNLLHHQLVSMHCILNSLNIEHYFIETICDLGITWPAGKDLNLNLPFIEYRVDNGRLPVNLSTFLMWQGFRPASCGHFDHDANEFLAKYLLDQIIVRKK